MASRVRPPLVLLTGGAGFIGSHTARRLVQAGCRVRLLDSLDPQIHGPARVFPRHLPARVEKIRGAVNDKRVLARVLKGVDAVGHFAARTGVGQSMYDLESYAEVNVAGTAALLEAVLRRGAPYPRFLLASSRAVYGEGSARCPAHGLVYPGPRGRARLEAGEMNPSCPRCGRPVKPVPTGESHPFSPVSMYGWTKQAQEELCHQAARSFGLPVTVLRYFNVYGSHQSLVNPYTGLVSIFYNRLRAAKPLALYEGGRPLRDFVHVDDVARANVRALTGKFVPGVFNIGSGCAASVRALAETLAKAAGRRAILEDKGEFRAGDIFAGVADLRAARAKLGYAPRVSLLQGLREFSRWAAAQKSADALDRATAELRRRGLHGAGVRWKK